MLIISQNGIEEVNIHVGEIYVAELPARIFTLLGSCVAVCLWDNKLKIGGMNHYLLPNHDHKYKNQSGNVHSSDYRYGDLSIHALIQKLLSSGSKRKSLIAKVFGGGDRLYNKDWIETSVSDSVGAKNIGLAEIVLNNAGIPIAAKDIGGKNGRKIVFDTETGQVIVKKLVIENLEEMKF